MNSSPSLYLDPDFNPPHPFCELATFKAAYYDAVARGGERAVDNLLDSFKFTDDGAFPKFRNQHDADTTGKD